MLTKDQADIAAKSLLTLHSDKSSGGWFRPKTPAPARKWAPLGLAIGMGVGVIVGAFVNGSVMPWMSFGMFAGAVLGACFDKQIRPRFLAVIIGLSGLGGAWLWYLAHASV